MASTTIVHLIDDIDGSEAERSVEFGLDGTSYSIDLSATHIEELRTIFGPYVATARRVGRGRVGQVIVSRTPRGTAGAASRANKERNTKIRAWAAANGQQLAERGRIPQGVEEAYEKAMSPSAATPGTKTGDAAAELKPSRARKAPTAKFSGAQH